MFDALTNPKRETIERALKAACNREIEGDKEGAQKFFDMALKAEQTGRNS